jgi:hypothetical protein
MKNPTIISYLKYLFLRRYTLVETLFAFSLVSLGFMTITAFFAQTFNLTHSIFFEPLLITFGIMAMGFLFITIFAEHYRNYKKNIYDKTALPQDIKKLEKEVGFSVAHYLKEHEERLKSLEKISPNILAIYSIFIGVVLAFLAIILAIIIPYILKAAH